MLKTFVVKVQFFATCFIFVARIIFKGNSLCSYSLSGVDKSNSISLPKFDVISLVSGIEMIASTLSVAESNAFSISI